MLSNLLSDQEGESAYQQAGIQEFLLKDLATSPLKS